MLDVALNKRKVNAFETCALSGTGIFDALRTITKLVLADLKRKGIYQGAAAGKPKDRDDAPVVSPVMEEGLVKTLETRKEPEPQPEVVAQPPAQSRGLTFSEFWQPGTGRDQILAMEGDIERGDQSAAVKRAEGLLSEYVGKSDGQGPTTVEALLMLGVHGRHYARFRDSLNKDKPTKQDALFCLFFLADLELRMRAAGMQVEE